MQELPRWAALCTGRGNGEQVKNERASTRNGCGLGGGRKEGQTNNPENGGRKSLDGRTILLVLSIIGGGLG